MRRVAGTGVAMDLLVLRRREPDAEPKGEAWLETAEVGTPDGPVRVNEVFAKHPDWVLGELRAEHGQYGTDDVEVRPLDGPLTPRLDTALAGITAAAQSTGLAFAPRPSMDPGADVGAGQVVTDAGRGPHHVERSLLTTSSGGFAMVRDGVTVAYEPPRSQAGELRSLIELRDTYFDLVDAQTTAGPDEVWQGTRQRLNDLYDRYHQLYGPVGRYKETPTGRYAEDGTPIMARRYPPMGGFYKDPGLGVVRSLEHFDSETKTATKAAIFDRRILAPRQVVQVADTPEDALAVCLDEQGTVDVSTIGRLLGCGETEARARLGTLVYDDPAGGAPLPAAAYLSGDVRARLVEARAAAAVDRRWQTNVAALEGVQPRDLEPGEIDARLGASWIPTCDVEAFCAEVLEADVIVEYAAATGEWSVRLDTGSGSTVTLTSEWGTSRVNGIRLVEANANQRVVSVTDEGPGGTRIPNLPETLAAREKQEAIAERFGRWVWEDPERSARLAGDYNVRFNSTVLPAYDGSHLSLPGLAANFDPHPHQRDAAWRMLSEPTVLLAHGVGAGKTATMVIGGRELKRLGMVNKPGYVVPNHMLEQFSREYLQLYPQAKILVASKDDVSPASRKEFVARCAADDWDAVILTQSGFERIPVSAATERLFLDARIADLRASIAASTTDGKGISVKQLEKTLARVEERHKALVADDRRDEGGVTFEATGIDYLVVDEAHAHKNLAITSHIQGIGSDGSKRAEDMAMKVDWLRSTHGTRVATFATATPIANSVAEMYVMQRYLQPATLARAGVEHFDGWAANFGRTVTALELAPDASTYRMNTRFARFANVPDLLRMFRSVADVRTGDQLHLAVPDLAGGRPETVVVAASDDLTAYVATLADRAEQIRNRAVAPEDDNMLKVSGDGRKAALDLRLVGLPPDPAGGKIAAAADRIAAIHARHQHRAYLDGDGVESPRRGGLQLVFCDLGTPQRDNRWTVYDQLRAELVARGLPGETVVFMHDARNDAEKARLFAAARAGSIAVLVGSTEKMGVGTNVQVRAVALHHLDCPWRPADLEQRDGRILRQGNQNPEVEVIRYVTEGSFDVFSWQTVERKAAFINQVMRGDITERSVDDVGDAALSYAEVKALATGNPLIMERAGVDSELTKLERLHASYRNEQSNLARRVHTGERDADEQTDLAATYRHAAARAVDTSGERFAMVVDHHPYRQRTEAATALQHAVLDAQRHLPVGERRAVPVGELAGFDVIATVSKDSSETSATLGLAGVPRSTPTFTRDELRHNPPLGMITRLENLASDLEARADQADRKADELSAEAAKAAARIGRPFEQSNRIDTLRRRLSAIDAELAPPEPPPASPPTEPVAPSPAPTPALAERGAAQRPSGATSVGAAAIARDQMARRRMQQRPGPGFSR
jgi:N12 class adenine-specific DNA methylase